MNKAVSGKVMISIVDIAGRVVSEASYNANERIEMNIAALAKGTYMVKVSTEDAQSIQRIIKN
jgi:hypothetical protein